MLKLLALVALVEYASAQCNPTITSVTGWHAPAQVCAGALLFEDNFDWFDLTKWDHEKNSDGGGNNEFQEYVNSRENSYVADGILHIVPTLTLPLDQPPQTSLPSNPVKSGRLRSREAFAFKYGRLEINAKLPAGDWIWPALWLLPEHWVFGGWPMSGEIDLMESRGNANLEVDGINIGREQVGSTLHFGPPDNSGWPTALLTRNQVPGFHTTFHKYSMIWTPDRLEFFIDDVSYNNIEVGTGFWDRGNFEETGAQNPWVDATISAPFDQYFHILMNVAVGGTFFPDEAINSSGPKPWSWQMDWSTWQLAFWNGREQWLPTWNMETEDRHFLVDYVRVWAL